MDLGQIISNEEMNKFLECVIRKAHSKYYLDRYFDYKDIEDFKQECYLDLVKALTVYDEGQSGVKTFLYSCVNKTALNAVKKQNTLKRGKNYETVSLSSMDDLLNTIGDQSSEFESSLWDDGLIQYLLDKHKDDSLFETIIRMLIEGYSAKQIKNTLGLSNNKVYGRIDKLRKDVRDYYGGKEYDR